jgi:hypothetical protein
MDEATRLTINSILRKERNGTMDDTIALKFKLIDDKLNRMADAFDAEIRSAKIRLDVLSQAGEHIAKAQLEILDRVEALEAGVVKGATEQPAARVTGEPTEWLMKHLEWLAETLKDIDWPAHSAAVTSAVELLRQPAPQAPQGVTVHALVRVLSHATADAAGAAYVLWDHPRIGPLLRGEGAPAAVPVVLKGWKVGWAATRAEIARQQGGQDHD